MAKLDNATIYLAVKYGYEEEDNVIVPVSFVNSVMRDVTLRNIVIKEDDNVASVVESTFLVEAEYLKAGDNQEKLSRLDEKYRHITTVDLADSGFVAAHARFLTIDFRDADLTNASFFQATLTGEGMYVDFSGAILIGTDFRLANITDCNLWETRRSNWKIKGVKCDAAFWDEGLIERHIYNIGEFERSYAENAKIRLQYPGGMSAVELAMLPIIIARLENDHPDCTLHIRSIEDNGVGAVVSISIEFQTEEVGEQRSKYKALENDLLFIQERLKHEERLKVEFAAEYEVLAKEIFPALMDKLLSRDTISVSVAHLNGSVFVEGPTVGDETYNVYGQGAAIGRKAHAEGSTLQQSQSGSSANELIGELAWLRKVLEEGKHPPNAIAAVESAQAAAKVGDGAVSTYLGSAGRETLSVAEKIGIPVVIEMLKNALT